MRHVRPADLTQRPPATEPTDANHSAISNIGYRADIDGLRAIAVMSVVLYHFGLGPLTGGFVGVDIFFVISGYLITSIISREILERKFSVARFYKRRTLRLLPAYFFVALSSLSAGYLYLLPDDFLSLGRQISYATLGAANFYFLWNSGGYFDVSTDYLPMLHMWSLGVEEQFYIIWPFALLWATKLFGYSRKTGGIALAAISAISFAAAAVVVRDDQPTAFYMLHTRAWELGMGGLLAFFPSVSNRTAAELMRALGLGLIAYAIFHLSGEDVFPGPLAAIPCVGAALLIWPSKHTPSVSRALSTRPLVAIGLISYSLYLWHWPLVVFARHRSFDGVIDQPTAFVLLAASLSLAAMTYAAIEKPFRRGLGASTSKVLISSMIAMFAAGGVAYAVVLDEGLPDRLSPEVVALASATRDYSPNRKACHFKGKDEIRPETSCIFGARAEPTSAMWADSHGMELADAIGERLSLQTKSLRSITYSSCPPAMNFARSRRPGCEAHNEETLRFLLATPKIEKVFMVAHFALYDKKSTSATFRAGFAAAVRSLSQAGKQVVLFSPLPKSTTSVPIAAAKVRMFSSQDPSLPYDEYLSANASILEFLANLTQLPNVSMIRVDQKLCSQTECKLLRNGKPLFFDSNHLSLHGARAVAASLMF